MVFDAFSELGEEYREYRMIQPENLDYRPASDDAERRTAAALSKGLGKEAIILFAVGGGLVALGILAVVGGQFGGIMLAFFGIAPIIIGFVKMKQGKNSNLVATGIVVKKESQSSGTINNRDRRTYRWIVIEVDGMEKALSVVHADQDNFDEANVGDRFLVINDKATYRGKKLL